MGVFLFEKTEIFINHFKSFYWEAIMWNEARQDMGLQEPVHVYVDQGSHSGLGKIFRSGKIAQNTGKLREFIIF